MATTSNNTFSWRLTTTGAQGETAYLATQSTFVAIATLLVFARIYVRTIVIQKFGLDDAVIVLALILSLIVCAMTSLTVHYITLYLAEDSSTDPGAIHDLVLSVKWSSIAAPIRICSGLCTRLSICLFLLRIFVTERAWKWGLYTFMAFVTAVTIPTIVSLLAQCSPVQKLWDSSLPGSCWSSQTAVNVGYVTGGASVLFDWILATLPIVFMWNIQMKVAVKIGICVLMGFGYFTGICALVRTILSTNGNSAAGNGGSIEFVVWAILEINVGIIAASIPTLKPLFDPSRPSILRYLKHRRASDKHDKTTEKIPANDIDDRICLQKLSLKPSAMPSSLPYYQGKGRNHGQGWENLEAQVALSNPGKAHVSDQGRAMEMEDKVESGGGDGVCAGRESMV